MSNNSFGARAPLLVGDRTYDIFRLDALGREAEVARLPFSLKLLLENLLRHEDGTTVTAPDVEALVRWDPTGTATLELAFSPARVLMQDFTGVPAVVDLAAMRDAILGHGGDVATINPLIPTELVIDHSVVADHVASREAFARNAELEFQRNRERYRFLRWGAQAFAGFKVVPPDTGIVHQINLEYLARVVCVEDGQAYPDTLLGTDSHTTMVNGLGVLGWGVGGIEAEAAMLGQPVSMLMPQVIGFKLSGELPEGSTATDLVLTVTEMLRRHGVVGRFVEFYGPGVGSVALADRATIGNMSPEYGSTVAVFPIDEETLRYLEFTGRPAEQIALVEAYAKEQGLWHSPSWEGAYSQRLELDLSAIVPSLAGPKRPQDRVPLDRAKKSFRSALAAELPGTPVTSTRLVPHTKADEASEESFPASDPPGLDPGEDDEPGPLDAGEARDADPDEVHSRVPVRLGDGTQVVLDHGHVVIAAITSCTNTSNPPVMLAAALLARSAVERGLSTKPWVKTSLAPGSKVVMNYYERAGLLPYLEKLGFHLVGYGCTTCIGNSGPLAPEISEAIEQGRLAAVSVLSGNRNFEGRINPDCRMNYLASPPLVIAYALAGTMDIDILTEPLGTGSDGQPVYLRDLWPSADDVDEVTRRAVQSDMFRTSYADVFDGDERWKSLDVTSGERFTWDHGSTYVRRPPYFDDMSPQPEPIADIRRARALALLGDSVTTDHISPAGVIKRDSPAGRYLVEEGVPPAEFSSYGARRGNHEVMIRGTFANIRLRNGLVPDTEGGVTLHLPDREQTTIYEAAMRYQADGVPLIVLAGKEYGSGSSRDWAAKGTRLLGVRAVLAESYERIHRSNLVGMGVLPLQFQPGSSVASLGLTGHELFDIVGLQGSEAGKFPHEVTVLSDGKQFVAHVRIDTPNEVAYFRHGGILPYMLRRLRRQAPDGVGRDSNASA